MRKIIRNFTPYVLAVNWKRWGRAFKASGSFTWHQVSGKKVNHIIEADLLSLTQDHCAFCDGYPFGFLSQFTIEHFKPKAEFKLLAFKWENLFPCCTQCQAASNLAHRNGFNKKVLKPDDASYSFNKYFIVDFVSGEISENPNLPANEQQRVKATISTYDLNSTSKCKVRLSQLNYYNTLLKDGKNPILDDFSFRYFIEASF